MLITKCTAVQNENNNFNRRWNWSDFLWKQKEVGFQKHSHTDLYHKCSAETVLGFKNAPLKVKKKGLKLEHVVESQVKHIFNTNYGYLYDVHMGISIDYTCFRKFRVQTLMLARC